MEESIDELVSNPDWGVINFEGAKSDLERAFESFRDFQSLPFEIIPDEAAWKIVRGIEVIRDVIREIKTFSIVSGGGHPARRDSIQQNLKQAVDDFLTQHQVWIPYLLYKRGDLQKVIDELSNVIGRFNRDAAKIQAEARRERDKIAEKRREIDEIVAAAREASASVGVEIYTADFSKEADSLSKRSRWWLGAGALFFLLTSGAASFFIFFDVVNIDGIPALLQVTTSKFILLGLLFSTTFWCGRNYRALMHQASINRHRANALKTFQTFNKSASDEDSKKAILLETTKAIFRVTSTGYLDKEPPTGQE